MAQTQKRKLVCRLGLFRYQFLSISFITLVVTGCATTPAAPENILAQLSKESVIRSVVFPGARFSVMSSGEKFARAMFGGVGVSEDSLLRGDEYVVRYKLKNPTLDLIKYFGAGLNAALGVNNFDTKPSKKSQVQTGFAFSFQTKLVQIEPTIPHSINYWVEAGLRDIDKSKTVWLSTCKVAVTIKSKEEHDELSLKLKLNEVTKKCAEELLHFVGEAKYNAAVQAAAKAAEERANVIKASLK